ncbi:regulator of G-protein signaling 9-binding protein-like [Periophthalmus magnuspinnatus]|uniref:regulator of G-protein signaling 9-binding protein-like n=1 Tax=Periophthalmus magnuspinnatus TaxID=409849 RepID=UPI00145A803B|nr:regulator of G-protein signaling 9-binding protein-like [Periophthalmus magnuspinnatus]XP_055087779.1 regulator of G-protein signaling 9-binding protein-like [Periophthalmus magnuspinnatus]
MAVSLWRRSLEEVSLQRRQQAECERAQEALSRVTSCFQQLASSLGSSADDSFLREELHKTRSLAHRISQGLARRLIRLLSASDSAPLHDPVTSNDPTRSSDPAPSSEPAPSSDGQVSERLWVNFLSAMECFLSDLRKVSDLIDQFPLTQRSDRCSLINSGCMDGVLGLAAGVAAVQAPWISLDEDPTPDLQNHIRTLDHDLQHLQQRVPVAFWGVEPSKPLWFQLDLSRAEVDSEQSLEELMTVNTNNDATICCHCCV